MSTKAARTTKAALRLILTAAFASGSLGLSCDGDAQAVFRQAATGQIGDGVKEVLGGNGEQGANTIISAAIDGLVASIQQAGDGPNSGK